MSIGSNRWFVIALGLSVLVHGMLLFFETTHKQSGEQSQASISVLLVPVTQAAAEKTAASSAEEPVSHKIISTRVVTESVNRHDGQQSRTNITRVLSNDRPPEDDQPDKHSLKEPAVQQDESLSSLAQSEQRSLSGEEKQVLLSLLHREINAKKQYPYLAIRQRRQGRVSLNFMLHPDGRISDIAIIESSRFEILDHAARSAIEKVSPFRLATNYLQQTELFNVDIEFRLN